MRKNILCFILFLIIAVSNTSAQGVDREELERNLREVEFINFMGPHEVIESRSAIMSIGHSLASAISAGRVQASTGRYRVLHLVDPTEPDKMGADIFIIEADARVDHIRNLRLMLAGYLSRMYNYSDQDAMIIATLVTYYNAVYRGDLDYFGRVFINKVMVNLSRENAGIDTFYRNWPGRTRLVIPLRSAPDGTAERPDLFVLADREVIDDLRRDDGMGLDLRKQIVELKEEVLAEDRQALAEREEVISEREEEITQRESAIEQRERELEERQAAGEITEREARDEQQRIEAERDVIAEERRQLEEERQEAEAQRMDIEEREDIIAAARESIVQDANVVREREAAAAAERGEVSVAERLATAAQRRAPFLMLDQRARGLLGNFVFFDMTEEKVLIPDRAPVVGGRFFIDTPAGYAVPAQNERGNFVLTILSREDLSPILRSNEEIHPQSFLLFLDNKIYCAVRQGNGFVIGRFSQDLVLEATSDIEAFADTFIVSSNNYILFQDRSGTIVVVDRNTLKAVP